MKKIKQNYSICIFLAINFATKCSLAKGSLPIHPPVNLPPKGSWHWRWLPPVPPSAPIRWLSPPRCPPDSWEWTDSARAPLPNRWVPLKKGDNILKGILCIWTNVQIGRYPGACKIGPQRIGGDESCKNKFWDNFRAFPPIFASSAAPLHDHTVPMAIIQRFGRSLKKNGENEFRSIHGIWAFGT